MSSSHQNLQNKPSTLLLCPTCGKKALYQVVEDVIFEIKDIKNKAHKIPHLKCSKCNERYFDQIASKQIDQQLLPKYHKKQNHAA